MPRKKIDPPPAPTAEKVAEIAALPDPDPTLTPTQLRQRREGLQLSRAALAQLAQVTQSVVWRSEQEGKEVPAGYLKAIIAALQQVDEHGLPDNLKKHGSAAGTSSSKLRAAHAELKTRLDAVIVVLEESQTLKTNAQLRASLEMALATALGSPSSDDDATAEPTESAPEPATEAPAPSEEPEPEPAGEPTTDVLVAA